MKKSTKIVIGVVAGLCIIGALSDSDNNENYNEPTEPSTKIEESVPEEVVEVEEEEIVEEVEEEVPFEFEQALKKAQSYIDHSSFSENDLRGQLEYHEFSSEAIQYALDNVEVDYQEECIEKAESYLRHTSFSENDLRGQLEYHEFNSEHIEQAIQETYR